MEAMGYKCSERKLRKWVTRFLCYWVGMSDFGHEGQFAHGLIGVVSWGGVIRILMKMESFIAYWWMSCLLRNNGKPSAKLVWWVGLSQAELGEADGVRYSILSRFLFSGQIKLKVTRWSNGHLSVASNSVFISVKNRERWVFRPNPSPFRYKRPLNLYPFCSVKHGAEWMGKLSELAVCIRVARRSIFHTRFPVRDDWSESV